MPDASDRMVEELVDKLRSWLLSQPTWPVVLASSRETRKRVARVVAREVTRVPHIEAFPESAKVAAAQAAAAAAVKSMGLEVVDANRTDR